MSLVSYTVQVRIGELFSGFCHHFLPFLPCGFVFLVCFVFPVLLILVVLFKLLTNKIAAGPFPSPLAPPPLSP